MSVLSRIEDAVAAQPGAYIGGSIAIHQLAFPKEDWKFGDVDIFVAHQHSLKTFESKARSMCTQMGGVFAGLQNTLIFHKSYSHSIHGWTKCHIPGFIQPVHTMQLVAPASEWVAHHAWAPGNVLYRPVRGGERVWLVSQDIIDTIAKRPLKTSLLPLPHHYIAKYNARGFVWKE